MSMNQIFNSILFDKLSILEEYIIREHRRAESEKGRAEELKKKADEMEARSDDLRIRSIRAAHEFQIPLQSMVALSEYLYKCIKSNNEKLICGGRKSSNYFV